MQGSYTPSLINFYVVGSEEISFEENGGWTYKQTMDHEWSQKLILSRTCSGELKKIFITFYLLTHPALKSLKKKTSFLFPLYW